MSATFIPQVAINFSRAGQWLAGCGALLLKYMPGCDILKVFCAAARMALSNFILMIAHANVFKVCMRGRVKFLSTDKGIIFPNVCAPLTCKKISVIIKPVPTSSYNPPVPTPFIFNLREMDLEIEKFKEKLHDSYSLFRQ